MSRSAKLVGPAILLISLAVLLPTSELIYRAYLKYRYTRVVADVAVSPWRLLPGDARGYALRPSYDGQARFALEPEKTFTFRTNRDGFREREVATRSAGVRRVAVVGDSYAFGWGLPVEEAFPRVLEAELKARGEKVEVLNCAVPGYGTTQELEVVRFVLPAYRPDLVVLAYVMNDAEPQGTVPSSPSVTYAGCRLWLWEDVKDLLDRRVLPRGLRLPLCKKTMSSDYLQGFRMESNKWRESRAALASIVTACQKAGVPLLLAVLPDFSDRLDETYSFAPIHRTVIGWGHELGVPTVDVLPTFVAEHPPRERYAIAGDLHPNAAAHRRVAEVLLGQVESMLPPS